MRRSALWMAVFIISIVSFCLYYVDVGPLGLRPIVFVGSILLLFFRKRLSIRVDKLLVIFMLFGLYGLILKILILHEPYMDALYTVLYDVGLPLMLWVILESIIRDKKGVEDSLAPLMFVALITSVFVVGQFLQIEPFWNAREMLGEEETFERPNGLARSPIDLSYQLAMLTPLSFIFFSRRNWSRFIPVVLLLACVLSLTRTTAFVGIMSFIAYLMWKYRAKGFLISTGLVMVLLTVVVFITVPDTSFSRLGSLSDASAQSRIVLFSEGIRTFMSNPWGVGYNKYVESANTGLTPHNHFINTAVFFGLPGIVLLVWFTLSLAGTVLENLRRCSSDIRDLCFVLILGIASFVFNSLFHNDGFFSGNGEIFYLVVMAIIIRKSIHHERAALS